MAVRYKLTKINDNITDNKTVKYSVTTVSYDNVNLDALAEQIAGSSTFSYGEVKDPLKIRAESIKLKGIGFKPSPKLKERLRSIEFTRMK